MIRFITTFLFLIFCTYGQSHVLTNSKKQVPPGTVKVNEGFYFDATEITNFGWLEYVNWNKKNFGNQSSEYCSSLPDTTVWGQNDTVLTRQYFRHPAFRNYPVVGVSFEQATQYCAWRSDRVNEYFFATQNKKAYAAYQEDPSSVTIPKRFSYRLPTQEEWKEMAKVGYSKKAERKKGIKHNLSNAQSSTNDPYFTAPAYSGFGNLSGVYCLTGNVAEMTNKKNEALGGSWKHTLEESQRVQTYNKPTNWLGFRCVCDRLE